MDPCMRKEIGKNIFKMWGNKGYNNKLWCALRICFHLSPNISWGSGLGEGGLLKRHFILSGNSLKYVHNHVKNGDF
jgi:hypothetical protein